MYSDSGSIPGVPYAQSYIITGCKHMQSVCTYRNHVFRFRFNSWGTALVLIKQNYIITGCKLRVFRHTGIIIMFKFRFNY